MHQGLEGGAAPEAFTIWFTGLSGAGKTTLSRAVCEELQRHGREVEWLDGDIVRQAFGNLLGFSKQDRDLNVRCLGFLSQMLNKHGVVSVVGAIAPYAEMRARNREAIGAGYVEVYCRCSLEVAARRDVKGLYKRAMQGEIKNFTAVADPYEEPQHPEILVETDTESVEQSLERILGFLRGQGLL